MAGFHQAEVVNSSWISLVCTSEALEVLEKWELLSAVDEHPLATAVMNHVFVYLT